MVKKKGLRIEAFSSVSITVPMKIADENPNRFKLKVRSVAAAGCYIGLDEGMDSDTAYFMQQYEELEIEKYKGPLYALSITAAGALHIIEEDE
jgi:hypothetical protein